MSLFQEQLVFWADAGLVQPHTAHIRKTRSLRLMPWQRQSSRHVPLVLASGSPAKREVLRLLGLKFCVDPAEVDERSVRASSPSQLVLRLATLKAHAIAPRHSGALILGADTVIVHDNNVVGKPHDVDDARRTLTSLAGRTHQVITGLVLIDVDGASATHRTAITHVTFRSLSAATIDRYLATGEPIGKAGAYALQGTGALLVQKVDGEYPNVFGMPVVSFVDALGELGYELM